MLTYNSTPANSGGFTPVMPGSAGYVNQSQGIPFYTGRSIVASIPEYQRDPFMLATDLVGKVKEGRANMSKILFDYAKANGRITKSELKYRWRIDVSPHGRFYLAPGTYAGTNNVSTFKLTAFTKPYSIPNGSKGNAATVGDIARLQAGDFILLMFSWTVKGRATKPAYRETYSNPIPEIAKVISVDYAANSLTVDRHFAGSQRQTANPGVDQFLVKANGTDLTGHADWIEAKNAFFVKLPRTMMEDDIDGKIYSMTGTWGENIMQRHLVPWGAGHLQEVINRNMGQPSKLAQNRTQAIEDFYSAIEMAAYFGEKDEGFDPETNKWWGMTDGLLTNIPKGHFIGIKPIDYATLKTAPTTAWGSFDIPIFNQIIEPMVYHGNTHKVALCGAGFHSAFTTMINNMTQNIPDIKSEWSVEGKRFKGSNDLILDVIPSDKMTLNGMRNKCIIMDPSEFRLVDLQGYPIDIVEVQNENPLLSNGFIHGFFSFANTMPEAHWVLTLDSTADILGSKVDE